MNSKSILGLEGRVLRFWFIQTDGDYEQGRLILVADDTNSAMIERGNFLIFHKDFGEKRQIIIDMEKVYGVKLLS